MRGRNEVVAAIELLSVPAAEREIGGEIWRIVGEAGPESVELPNEVRGCVYILVRVGPAPTSTQ